MDIEIRKLTPADAESFRTLRLRGLWSAPTAFGSSYEEESAEPVQDVEARLRQRLSPRNAVYGAFVGTRLVGMVGIHQEAAQKRAYKAHLWGMYVEQDYRGHHVGRKLVEHAIEFAKGIPGVEFIELGVGKANQAALRLYKSLGFRVWGTEPGALRIGEQDFDEHYMTRRL